MNEGGFFGDRAGWHLPGFDDSAWNSTRLSTGLSRAGVRYFRTTFDLDIPGGYDVKMSFNFPPYGEGTYRAFLYVNGSVVPLGEFTRSYSETGGIWDDTLRILGLRAASLSPQEYWITTAQSETWQVLHPSFLTSSCIALSCWRYGRLLTTERESRRLNLQSTPSLKEGRDQWLRTTHLGKSETRSNFAICIKDTVQIQ
jgi:hypothetical protein